MSIFIVEKGAEGLKIADPVETMGLRGVPIAAVSLYNCRPRASWGASPGKDTNR